MLWEHRFNVFHSTIPFNRLGWTSLAGDTETGYIYAHTISGVFACFDKDGKIVWSHSLTEEFGRFTGYGGRTVTPVVDKKSCDSQFPEHQLGEPRPDAPSLFRL